MKKFRLIVVLFLVLCLVTGCGGSNNGSSEGGETKKNTSKSSGDNIVRIASDLDIASMDHSIATDGTSFIAIASMISGLTQLDAAGVPIGALAETWDVDDAKTTYTFHLRDGITWVKDDGSYYADVTADDFVYSWNRLVDPALASEYAFIVETANIKNYYAKDAKTLVVELSLPCDFLLSLMAFPSFFLMNEAFVKETGDQYAKSTSTLLSCGPFYFTEWNVGSEWVFTKNPTYFAADEVTIEGLDFKLVQDTQSAMLEFEQGNFDVVKLSGDLVELYKDRPEYTGFLQGYLWYMSLNEGTEALANVNIRKALAWSINRDLLCSAVLKDGSISAKGIIPEQFATGPDGKDYRDTTDAYYGFDQEKAKEYMKKGREELGGGKISLELLYEDTDASKAVAQYVAYVWEETFPGLEVTLNVQPKKTRLQLMRDKDYDIGLTRWGPDYADPQTYLDLFLTANDHASQYSSAEYDAMITEATKGQTATDSAARWDMFKKAEALLIGEDCAVIPVYQNGGAYMINSSVTGIEFHSVGIDNYSRVTKAK